MATSHGYSRGRSPIMWTDEPKRLGADGLEYHWPAQPSPIGLQVL